jgi:uncharacterized membrane protein (DUF106 family)
MNVIFLFFNNIPRVVLYTIIAVLTATLSASAIHLFGAKQQLTDTKQQLNSLQLEFTQAKLGWSTEKQNALNESLRSEQETRAREQSMANNL